MFRFRLWMAWLIALATALPLAAAVYRSVSRSMAKPKYALLVFGPEAKTRVLIAQDGETLYVDRNGDGKLTGKEERFPLNGRGSVGDCNIEIRDADKKTRYVITSMSIHPESDKPDASLHLMAFVDIKGQVAYRQYCDAKLNEKRDKAAIAHFHGPLTIGPRTFDWKLTPKLSRLPVGDSPDDIFAVVGTMDAERGCWVVVRSEDLPKDLHPVVEIEYPAKRTGDAPIKERYQLKERC